MNERDNEKSQKVDIGPSTHFDLLEIPEEKSRKMAKVEMENHLDTQRFKTRLILGCGTIAACGATTLVTVIIRNYDKIEAHLENMFK